jgi:hypothetical protein
MANIGLHLLHTLSHLQPMSTKQYRSSLKGWARLQHYRSRNRAQELDLDFDLTTDWLLANLPQHCPVLGIPIVVGCDRNQLDNAPSVDRVDNSKGYTMANCRIISYRANHLKNSASRQELHAILQYMSQHQLASVTVASVDTHLL